MWQSKSFQCGCATCFSLSPYRHFLLLFFVYILHYTLSTPLRHLFSRAFACLWIFSLKLTSTAWKCPALINFSIFMSLSRARNFIARLSLAGDFSSHRWFFSTLLSQLLRWQWTDRDKKNCSWKFCSSFFFLLITREIFFYVIERCAEAGLKLKIEYFEVIDMEII